MADIRQFSKEFLRRPDWVAAAAISLFVVWQHLFFLHHAGALWRDEVNLVNLSGRHSLDQMSRDSFPLLMPLLVGGWSAIGLGQNDFSLRILGTLIGLAIPAALWFAVWKIRRAPPLLGLVLLALNAATIIKFGDSLRAFGVGSLTILLTVAAACLFLKKPTWPRTAALAALAVLSVQALYQNSVFIMAICFGAWAVCLREKNPAAAVKILVVAAVSASSLLPYWSHIASMPDAAAALRTGFDPQSVMINLDNAAGFPLEQYLWVWGFLALAVVVCAGLSLRRQPPAAPVGMSPFVARTMLAVTLAVAFGFVWFAASPRSRWFVLPLMLMAVAALDSARWTDRLFPRAMADANLPANPPTGCEIAAGSLPLFAGVTLLTAVAAFGGFLWFAALTTEPWYFIPLLALAAVCFEVGLPLSGCHARAAVFGFALTTVIGAVIFSRGELDWRFTNLDFVAQRLVRDAGPEDFIIVTPWYCGISFDRYFKGATPWNTLPPLKDHTIHRYDLVREQMETRGALQPVLAQMAAALQSGHRVWLVGVADIPKSNAPPAGEPGPPPLKYSGWSDRPYNSSWAAMAAQFLAQHSRQFGVVYWSTNLNGNPSENLKLGMAEGWRDFTNLPSSVPSQKGK